MKKKSLIFLVQDDKILLCQKTEDYATTGFWSPYGGKNFFLLGACFSVLIHLARQTGRNKKFSYNSLETNPGIMVDQSSIREIGRSYVWEESCQSKCQYSIFTANIVFGVPVETVEIRSHGWFSIAEILDPSFKMSEQNKYFVVVLSQHLDSPEVMHHNFLWA